MASLLHTTDQDPGIRRLGAGRGFYYRDEDGEKVTSPEVLNRIDSLAIPPAYRDVWICPIQNGHLQATGRDTRDRKQYRYHPLWHELQNREKFEKLPAVGAGLPRLRRRVRAELKDSSNEKLRVVSAAVRLLDKLGHRVGNDTYLQENDTRGISTLADENVQISEESLIQLSYVGKGGKKNKASFSDPLLAETIQACHELPGQRLFQYEGAGGAMVSIDSSDVNDFLQETFEDDISAKDLRTWRASVSVVDQLRKISRPDDRESELRDAIRGAAREIHNRYETCRKHYVHPDIEESWMNSSSSGFSRRRPQVPAELQIPEALLLQILAR